MGSWWCNSHTEYGRTVFNGSIRNTYQHYIPLKEGVYCFLKTLKLLVTLRTKIKCENIHVKVKTQINNVVHFNCRSSICDITVGLGVGCVWFLRICRMCRNDDYVKFRFTEPYPCRPSSTSDITEVDLVRVDLVQYSTGFDAAWSTQWGSTFRWRLLELAHQNSFFKASQW